MNVKLFRVVCDAEFQDILATGRFNPGPNSVESGKWFAETIDHARQWGDAFFHLSGIPHDRIVVADFDEDIADGFFRVPKLDGIGPARFATFDDLQSLISISLFEVV